MTRPAAVLQAMYGATLRCASLLVPSSLRGDWLQEWRAELWHVREACTLSCGIVWTTEKDVAMFCFGAFPDALWLRAHWAQRSVAHRTTLGSATQCLRGLAGLIAVSYGVALLLPGVSAARKASSYPGSGRLVLIHNSAAMDTSVATIPEAQFESWKRRRQQIFDQFAFYRVVKERLSTSSRWETMATVAVASPNLLSLLGMKAEIPVGDAEMPAVILSHDLWQEKFAGDLHVAGRVMRVGSRTAVIRGVAPEGFWRLPGKVDGWILEPEMQRSPADLGFVIGHLAARDMGEKWEMTAPTPDGTMVDYSCVSLMQRTHRPLELFLFAVFLACLALPATTSLPLGEYRVSSQKLSWPKRLRRWGFLGSKLAMLLPIVYFVSVDLAHVRKAMEPATSEYVQLVSAFSICLFGLRWVLRDQRQRCPMCLRRLTHPARVGQPSRNFLAWNGTELICVAGHGLLHIPEIQTSWFNTQRWLYLDPSWDVLFADPALASVTYF